MKKRIVASFALVAALCAAAGELTLAERGMPAAYSIVIPVDAGASVRYAADELRGYVREMTGVELPVVKGMRKSNSGKVIFLNGKGDGDAFRIRTGNGNVAITGGASGVLYGIYELLETYGGVGWFASWRTVVPQLNRFTVPDRLDDVQKPAFALRSTRWYDVDTAQNPAFAARLRLNGACNIPDGGRGEKFGGVPFRSGRGLGLAHTFDSLLPAAKHFESHPEWYSERKGRRIGKDTQLCLTNPDVLRIVTSNVLERIRKDPDATFYGVSQNDNANYCTCARCSAVDAEEESHSGTVVRFVNAVAEAVEKEFPDKLIETLAYTYSRKPPKRTKLRHNVFPCVCTIECGFSRPLGVSTNAADVAFEADIRGWAKQAKTFYVWDYVTNFRDYLYLLPNVRTFAPNLRFFRDCGAQYILSQGCSQGRHAEFAELKTWLLAKLMWNPDRDVEPLLDRFFAGYYGKAAPFARRYFEEAQALGQAEPRNWRAFLEAHNDDRVPNAFLVRATNIWAQAAAAVKDDQALSYNVRMSALSPIYTLAARAEDSRAKALVEELLDARKAAAGRIRWSEVDSRNTAREERFARIIDGAPAEAAVPPPPPPPKAEGDIRIMSYNIRHCCGAGNRTDVKRTANRIASENVDFVCLTEVLPDRAWELGKLTDMVATASGMKSCHAILSRKAPVRIEEVALPWMNYGPRSLLICEFDDCAVAVMHFDNGPKALKCRMDSAAIVLDTLSRYAKLVFIAGDWNAEPGSPPIVTLRKCVKILSPVKDRTWHGFYLYKRKAPPSDEYCIDYIAVDSRHSENVVLRETHIVHDNMTSDHYPVVATMRLTDAK